MSGLSHCGLRPWFTASTTTTSSNPLPLPHHRRIPPTTHLHRRRSFFLLSSAASLAVAAPPSPCLEPAASPPPDTTVTDRVFIDFSVCPTYFRQDRAHCDDSVPLGRVVLGLYGRLVPVTVANFKSVCTAGSGASSYKNTLVHKILPGQFFVAGRQGRRDKGEFHPPQQLPRNPETVDSRAFLLTHSRPGVVSLCLSENDDDDELKLDPDYRNVEFLITTGPAPCPQLDNKNIVFGTVLEGMDVVTAISSIPTYRPAERIRLFNDFAELLGDERAQIARGLWNRPLKTVYISDCGELGRAAPLSPSLP